MSWVVDWTPLIAATVTFAAYLYAESISDVAGVVSIRLHSADLHSSQAVQARLYWGLVLFLYATVFLTAVLAMLSCFWRIYGLNGVAAFGTLFLVIAIVLSFTENFLSIGSTTPLVRQAIAYHSLPSWAFEYGAIPGILGAYLMIGVAISCLRRRPSVAHVARCPTKILEQGREQAAAEIEQLQSLLRRALYAAAAILAVAMMFSSALLGLALPLTDKAELDSVKQLALSVSSAQGTVWSALLVAIYAPAALVLVSHAHRLADAGAQKGNRKAQFEWLEKHGLSRSVVEQLATATATFAPLLAGASAKLVELL